MALARKHRLPSVELGGLFSKARVIASDIAILRFRPTGDEPSRFAVIIPRKAAPSAVRRNALRRRCYAFINEHLHYLSPGLDAVLILKKGASELKRREFLIALEKIFKKFYRP